MKTLAAFLCSFIFVVAYGQDVESIPFNSKFTLELVSEGAGNYSYKILSIEPFEGEIKTNSRLLDNDLRKNQIQGILAYGTFGAQRNVQVLIKSSLSVHLQYELLIDVKGNGKFQKTSTVPLMPGIPSNEIWPYNIYAIKFGPIKKIQMATELVEELDTACYSNHDLENGNILINKQLELVLDLISKQEVSGIDKMKAFEDSIKSVSKPTWGWGDQLNVLDSSNRFIGTYINRKKLAAPLVFELTECPYLKREVGYFYSKKENKLKFVVFKWSQRWAGGWQSRAYNNIEDDFRGKHKFIMDIINQKVGPASDIQESTKKTTADWSTKEGVIAKSSLYIDQYSRSIRLIIYLKED